MGELMTVFNKNIHKAGKELAGRLATVSVTSILTHAGIDALPSAYGGQLAGTFVNLLFNFSNEIDERKLSTLENGRVSAELLMICGLVKSELDAGNHVRDDDFFDASEYDRSSAEEIVEGVLNAVQFEHEQKKLIYYANLITAITFNDKINRENANFLLNIAKNLSYRDLCLTGILFHGIKFSKDVTEINFDIYIDMFKLYQTQILTTSGKSKGSVILGPVNIRGKEVAAGYIGKTLYEFMKLDTLSEKDIADIRNLL